MSYQGYVTMRKALARQATMYDYQRLSFPHPWRIQLRVPARKLLRYALLLARTEGNLNHARSLEARLSSLPAHAHYCVGRSQHGCATAEVVV